MQSVRFIGVGRAAQLEDVPKPSAGPGQVLIKIGGVGVSTRISLSWRKTSDAGQSARFG